MNLKQIQELTKDFQEQSIQLAELVPSSGMVQSTATLLRSSRQIYTHFVRLLEVTSEQQFNKIIDTMEEEMDEVTYTLDQLEIANKKRQISLVSSFLQEGYNLLSVYAKCCEHIIEKRIEKEE